MIGGIVIETIQLWDCVWVNCIERSGGKQTCAVYVENTDKARSISAGDKLWWQAGKCYWTPWPQKEKPTRSGIDHDIVLKKIGFSGVSRPQQEGMEILSVDNERKNQ